MKLETPAMRRHSDSEEDEEKEREEEERMKNLVSNIL